MTIRVVQFSTPITSLRINTSEWPEIASVKQFDATRTDYIRVLRHRDGSSIVYGMHSAGGKDKPGAEFVNVGGSVSAAAINVVAHCGCPHALVTELAKKLSG